MTYWDPSFSSNVRSPIAYVSSEDVQATEKQEEHQEEKVLLQHDLGANRLNIRFLLKQCLAGCGKEMHHPRRSSARLGLCGDYCCRIQ